MQKPHIANYFQYSRHGSIRRNAFITVLVLIAFFPLAIFALTYWVNRASASRTLDERLQRSVQNAQRLKNEVERALSIAEDAGYVVVQPAYRPPGGAPETYKTYVRPAFKQTLEEIEPGDEMLLFATLLDTRGNDIYSHGASDDRRLVGDVQVMPHDNELTLAANIRRKARETGNSVIRLAFPTTIGRTIAGTLVVGLSFEQINRQIHADMNENNRRALSISLAGSLLLAVLGAYLLRLNDRARMLQSALEREKHLAYIGTLSSGLAHEIRNPLSSISMNMQMIRRKISALDNAEKENLMTKIDRINRETDRLEESINDFLTFAAPKPLKKHPADFNAAVDSVVEFFNQGASEIEIIKDYDSSLPPIEIDYDMFTDMLQNLLINAGYAAGDGGTIEIQTFGERNNACVAVSDSGRGVAENAREKIFEVFYTTRKGGTGLGLNIARRIAEEHGGSITLEESSKLGGARFIVCVPLNGKRTKS